MSKRVSIGALIIGLGQIGMGYDLRLDPNEHVYSHARAFSLHPAFRLLGGVDTDAKRRQLLECEYRCPAFSDVETALDVLQPELVVIAAPTRMHADILGRVLTRWKPNVVLCEKPLSYDLAEACAMVQACKERGVQLFVNYMRRSDPGVVEIRRRLKSGEICSPVKGIAWYSKGMMHNGSHLFNLLEFWLDGMVSATVIEAGRLWDGIDPEPDVEISFNRGKVFFLAAKEENFSHYAVELLAENGRLRYERGGRRITWQSALADPAFTGYTTVTDEMETIESQMNRFQYNVVAQLALACQGYDANLSDGDDALRTIESLTTIIGRT